MDEIVVSSFSFRGMGEKYMPFVKDGNLLLPMFLGEPQPENLILYQIPGDLIRQIVKGGDTDE